MKRERFPLMISIPERHALKVLASREGVSQAAILRRLLRKEARQLGLPITDESLSMFLSEEDIGRPGMSSVNSRSESEAALNNDGR